MKIKRYQVTGYDHERTVLPQPKKDYFEYERAETSLGIEIIEYGYREVLSEENGVTKVGPWLRLEDVPESVKRERNYG